MYGLISLSFLEKSPGERDYQYMYNHFKNDLFKNITQNDRLTIKCHIFHVFISLPKHKVLMVSYCDRSLSVVRRRPSCVVRCA